VTDAAVGDLADVVRVLDDELGTQEWMLQPGTGHALKVHAHLEIFDWNLFFHRVREIATPAPRNMPGPAMGIWRILGISGSGWSPGTNKRENRPTLPLIGIFAATMTPGRAKFGKMRLDAAAFAARKGF
jgi:hypothetical protein